MLTKIKQDNMPNPNKKIGPSARTPKSRMGKRGLMQTDPMTGMPVQPNRGGMPSRSINDLQQINTIQDPGMQSAQQAAAFEKFNNIAQYNPPPAIMKSPAKKYTEPDRKYV